MVVVVNIIAAGITGILVVDILAVAARVLVGRRAGGDKVAVGAHVNFAGFVPVELAAGIVGVVVGVVHFILLLVDKRAGACGVGSVERPAAVVIDLKIAPFCALCAAGVGSGEGGEIFFGGVALICCVVEPVVRGNFICAVVQIEKILRRAVRLCCLLGAACKQQAERCQQNNGQKSQVLFHVQFLSQKKMLEMICIHYKSAQKRRRLTGG